MSDHQNVMLALLHLLTQRVNADVAAIMVPDIEAAQLKLLTREELRGMSELQRIDVEAAFPRFVAERLAAQGVKLALGVTDLVLMNELAKVPGIVWQLIDSTELTGKAGHLFEAHQGRQIADHHVAAYRQIEAELATLEAQVLDAHPEVRRLRAAAQNHRDCAADAKGCVQIALKGAYRSNG